MDKSKFRYLKNYLGGYFLTLTDKEEEYFYSLDIQRNTSYLVVCSNYNLLKKFMACYLTKDEYSYVAYDINDFIRRIHDSDFDTLGSNVLIIRYPCYAYERGKTEEHIRDVLLQTVASRNRINQSTVILAEKNLPYLQNSGEVITIKLNSSLAKTSDTVVNKQTGSSVKNTGLKLD